MFTAIDYIYQKHVFRTFTWIPFCLTTFYQFCSMCIFTQNIEKMDLWFSNAQWISVKVSKWSLFVQQATTFTPTLLLALTSAPFSMLLERISNSSAVICLKGSGSEHTRIDWYVWLQYYLVYQLNLDTCTLQDLLICLKSSVLLLIILL